MEALTVTKKQLERVCRMYKTSSDAARALGISNTSISRRCKRLDVATPRRRKKEASGRSLKEYLAERPPQPMSRHQSDDADD